MELIRQDWEQTKDKFIDTADMLPKHLVGYDILKRMCNRVTYYVDLIKLAKLL